MGRRPTKSGIKPKSIKSLASTSRNSASFSDLIVFHYLARAISLFRAFLSSFSPIAFRSATHGTKPQILQNKNCKIDQ